MTLFHALLVAKLGGTYPIAKLFEDDVFSLFYANRGTAVGDVVGSAVVGLSKIRG